jgi:glutamyl-tRNA synthetase
VRDELAKVQPWEHDSIERAVRGVAERNGVKAGLLINASRVALTGQAVAPPLFTTMELLGQPRVVSRLQRLVDSLPSL